MIVVDASVLISVLVGHGPLADEAARTITAHVLHAPELIDLEVTSAARRLVTGGAIDNQRALGMLTDLEELPLRRARHTPLLGRVWELRGNLTAYDAAYVALAEALRCPLATGDRRLAHAPGPRCEFVVL